MILNMPSKSSGPRSYLLRAVVEVGFIIFLFYANLLMGEFDRSIHKTLSGALHEIVTPANFAIALTAAFIGHIVVEFLRQKL
uniref:Uncharacterized protein n=2 Tax=Paracidobacterium acidisoli TaxID=2303751 RepID=A0A372IRL6_9BACT